MLSTPPRSFGLASHTHPALIARRHAALCLAGALLLAQLPACASRSHADGQPVSMSIVGFAVPPLVGRRKNFLPRLTLTRRSPSSSQATLGFQSSSQSANATGGELPSAGTLAIRRCVDCSDAVATKTNHLPSGDWAES